MSKSRSEAAITKHHRLVVALCKEPVASAGDRRDWVPSLGWEGALEEGIDNPLQDAYLENPMDRGVWQAISIGSLRVGHY